MWQDLDEVILVEDQCYLVTEMVHLPSEDAVYAGHGCFYLGDELYCSFKYVYIVNP